MRHQRFLGQTLGIILAAIMAVLPQAAAATTTPMSPATPIAANSGGTVALCPTAQKDIGITNYSDGTSDNTSLNWPAKTFEVRMAGGNEELALGMSFNNDYSRATLSFGGNGFTQIQEVNVATFVPSDVASLGKAIQQARLNPEFVGLFDEVNCRLGPNPHAQMESYKDQIKTACPDISMGNGNMMAVAAAALQCRDQIVASGSPISSTSGFTMNGGPSPELLGWLVLGILVGAAIVFIIFCGPCTMACGCVCC